MKKIINEPAAFVDETIDGILAAHPLALRAVTADRRALVRRDAGRPGKVGIVTGGGSGHLPLFLGYVGYGLLDGVAVGNVFSSPSPAQIAAATRAVSGGAGVLYLYGNYGGDIYNFDIAADIAGAEGIVTETALGADDVASAPADARSTRRGIAGLFYAFKIAGAAAERGDSLSEVAALARRVGDRVRSVGVGLSPTILPAAGTPSFVIGDDEMEVGIGIHGERGIHRGQLEPADAIADRMLDMIVDDLPEISGSTVSVLVNGMGATPLEELYVLYRRIAERLGGLGVTIYSPFVGNHVTSLEMAGASLSVLVLDDDLKALLDAPALSPFFQHGAVYLPTALAVTADQPEPASADTADEAPTAGGEPTPLAELLLAVLERMPAHSDELRDLDAALGDGDLGITVTAGSQAARAEIARDPSAPDAILLQRAGAAFAAANPSTFAALVGGGIIAASRTIGAGELAGSAAAADFIAALQERIVERGHAQLGDKTIVDVLDPTVAVMRSGLAGGAVDVLDAMIAVVDVAIAATTSLQSARGRAAWLRERSVGLKDPGMVAYHAFLQELRAVLAARA